MGNNKDMKKYVFSLTICMLFVTKAYAETIDSPNATTTYIRSGQFTYGSDGSSYTHYGNVTIDDKGKSYHHYGNMTVDSDGNTYTHYGNMTVDSRGNTYLHINY